MYRTFSLLSFKCSNSVTAYSREGLSRSVLSKAFLSFTLGRSSSRMNFPILGPIGNHLLSSPALLISERRIVEENKAFPPSLTKQASKQALIHDQEYE